MADRRLRSVGRVLLLLLVTCLALVVTALSVPACKPLEPDTPPTYNPTSCAEACNNAERLCGPTALKPKSGTCADVCKVTEEGGGDFRTGCLSAATACAEIDRCSR